MEHEIQEYPKALYRNGAYREVVGTDEEDAAGDDGWTDWHTDQARVASGDVELTRDEMKAKATELGLTFPHNISNAKLAELIASPKE